MEINTDKIHKSWLNVLALVCTSEYYNPKSDNSDIALIEDIINNYVDLANCPYYSPIDLRDENIMRNKYEYVSKKYEYGGKIYCEDNLSKDVDNYGGNIYDLYLALSRDHLANEKNEGNVTYYYAMDGAYDYENHYDLIELEFADLEVNEDE